MRDRVCDACGKAGVCYLAGGGWNCHGCAAARTVTLTLSYTLERLAEIAGRGPEEAGGLAAALRRGSANAFWGEMLQDMASSIETKAAAQGRQEAGSGGAAGAGDGRVAEIASALFEKARTADIAYDFPGLAAAYRGGRESMDTHGRREQERYDEYVRSCEARGYAPCDRREFKAPDERRWASNYLRHERSSYEDAYTDLQEEARDQLESDASLDYLNVVCERIHQIIKNRVQDRIAEEFPELAEAAGEQKV